MANLWVHHDAFSEPIHQPEKLSEVVLQSLSMLSRENTSPLRMQVDQVPAEYTLNFADNRDTTGCTLEASVASFSMQVLAQCDVLVVGGGTSGVPAAIAAARTGADVILIEHYPDVGGTQTVGGVGHYWFGRETPFQVACDEHYARVAQQAGVPREIGMRHALLDAGVRIFAPVVMTGVLCKDRWVHGVSIATDHGPAAVLAKRIIDATGDADVAAWGGSPFEFGTGRDAFTLWASFGNFNAQRRSASRQYESSLDTSNTLDMTRAAVRGRRRQGMWRRQPHDLPQLYPTARETRRIVGHAQVTYGGILRGQSFADVMTVLRVQL